MRLQGPRIAAGALAALVLLWAAAAAADLNMLLDGYDAPPAERKALAAVLATLHRECPPLKRLTRADVQTSRAAGAPEWEIGINDATAGWSAGTPFAEAFGWEKFVGLYIQLRSGGTIALDMGAGRRPGIASRTAGNYLGVDMCSLGDGPGGYTFREVPAMKVIDALK